MAAENCLCGAPRIHGELLKLDLARVVAISLTMKEAQKQDRFGNLFRYRSEIRIRQGSSTVSRFAYDVILTSS
jgi:hypothetical protein